MKISITGDKNIENGIKISNICMRTKSGRVFTLYLGDPEFEVHGGKSPTWTFEEESSIFLRAADRSEQGYHYVPVEDKFFKDITGAAIDGMEAKAEGKKETGRITVININEIVFETDTYDGTEGKAAVLSRKDGFPVFAIYQ